VQLAQTGLVNPLCLDTLQAVARKGLVLPGPRPRLLNQTFLRFVLTVEPPDTVAEWENDGGESSWPVIRNIVILLLAGGFAVVALTQREAMQTVIAAITGVGTVMAGLYKLVGFIGGRKAAPAEPAA